MPADRRTFTVTRPLKTERTHEENQERAYIAASRRSDRSLEARIESARRASEIHKKRTGRALRVTEQDVINEEMYEEEDDDLPTQYQRLNAHLHTTSVLFNKKLHDYIATQHGVRNMFMSQYQKPSFQPYAAAPFHPNPPANNWLNPSMPPPHPFNPAEPHQPVMTPPPTQQQQQHTQPQPQPQPQPLANNTSTAPPQQTFRQSPYQIPQRLHAHGRSLSIQLPQSPAALFDPSSHSAPGAMSTPHDSFRSMSLPPHALEHHSAPADAKPHTATAHSPHDSVSPQTASPQITSGQLTPQLHHDADNAASDPFNMAAAAAAYPFGSQALNSTPLAMSMPPESQQFLASAFDPNDPRTALFMAGSDNLPQFAPTYTYNPNFAAKSAKPPAAHHAGIKAENLDTSTTMPSDAFFTTDSLFTPGNDQYNTFFDFQPGDFPHTGEEQGDIFVNWD
ncbi:hypothetical protein ACEQ8H_000877 [Pleosporales sp. CAS-2024a]